MESPCVNIEIEYVKYRDELAYHYGGYECEMRKVFNCLWNVSLDSAGVEVSELEAGWRIFVGKDFQRKGAAELKERLTSSLKFDRWPAKSDD